MLGFIGPKSWLLRIARNFLCRAEQGTFARSDLTWFTEERVRKRMGHNRMR